ncbi:hypothetical protein ACFMQL_29820 [Nonomuraea fastidiosa]|uniref:hypothetical protein n=1 Tax=Nonomuraea TaxID=83681 RepID=UPI003252B947
MRSRLRERVQSAAQRRPRKAARSTPARWVHPPMILASGLPFLAKGMAGPFA